MTLSDQQLRVLEANAESLKQWARQVGEWLNAYEAGLRQEQNEDTSARLQEIEGLLSEHEQALKNNNYAHVNQVLRTAKQSLSSTNDFSRDLHFEGHAAELQAYIQNQRTFYRLREIVQNWAERLSQEAEELTERLSALSAELSRLGANTESLKDAIEKVRSGMKDRIEAVHTIRQRIAQSLDALERAVATRDQAEMRSLIGAADTALQQAGVAMDKEMHLLEVEATQLSAAGKQVQILEELAPKYLDDEVALDKAVAWVDSEATITREASEMINAVESYIRDAGHLLDKVQRGDEGIDDAVSTINGLQRALQAGLAKYKEEIRRDSRLLEDLGKKNVLLSMRSSMQNVEGYLFHRTKELIEELRKADQRQQEAAQQIGQATNEVQQ